MSDKGQSKGPDGLRLLVVDDHPVVLEGVKAMLEGRGWYVMGATTREEAMLLLAHAGPVDIVVLDFSIKAPTDGLSLLEDMRAAGFQGKSIIFTMHDELWNASLIEDAGVDGIVLKGDNPEELLAAMIKVAKGERYVSAGFQSIISEYRSANAVLTEKDIEVLHLVSRGISNSDIADKIFASVKTVEYHRSRILLKLHVS